ncbi:MAG: hypothetical protein HY007_02700 [Candidatus Sungbacteria bacterium]|nr:hypothetical protein [Candidatus Sungbacteria bacterium]
MEPKRIVWDKKIILSLLLIARLRQGFGGQALVIAGVFGTGHGVFWAERRVSVT